mmetsp:Transcript_103347/g.236811  ORF Transcript_103347/g.236811 Transcript_103347/m.236811 type:complete len:227 (-) Transcript_103347:293-973(-)
MVRGALARDRESTQRCVSDLTRLIRGQRCNVMGMGFSQLPQRSPHHAARSFANSGILALKQANDNPSMPSTTMTNGPQSRDAGLPHRWDRGVQEGGHMGNSLRGLWAKAAEHRDRRRANPVVLRPDTAGHAVHVGLGAVAHACQGPKGREDHRSVGVVDQPGDRTGMFGRLHAECTKRFHRGLSYDSRRISKVNNQRRNRPSLPSVSCAPPHGRHISGRPEGYSGL